MIVADFRFIYDPVRIDNITLQSELFSHGSTDTLCRDEVFGLKTRRTGRVDNCIPTKQGVYKMYSLNTFLPEMNTLHAVNLVDLYRLQCIDHLKDTGCSGEAQGVVTFLVVFFGKDQWCIVAPFFRIEYRIAVIANNSSARLALGAAQAVGANTDFEFPVAGSSRSVAPHVFYLNSQHFGDGLLEQQVDAFVHLPAFHGILVPEPIALEEEDPQDREGYEQGNQVHLYFHADKCNGFWRGLEGW